MINDKQSPGRDPDRFYRGTIVQGRYLVHLHEWDHAKGLLPRNEIFNHSPDGFAWGYGGSGPAQLALAILVDAGIGSERAVRLHQEFKWQRIATLSQGSEWQMPVRDVLDWVSVREENDRADR